MELTCRKKNSQLPFRKRDNILLTFKDKLSKIYSHEYLTNIEYLYISIPVFFITHFDNKLMGITDMNAFQTKNEHGTYPDGWFLEFSDILTFFTTVGISDD